MIIVFKETAEPFPAEDFAGSGAGEWEAKRGLHRVFKLYNDARF